MTKRIMKIAKEMNKDSMKKYDWLREEDLPHYIEQDYKELMSIRKALLNGRFYCGVNRVSQSGMSRNVTLAYIENNELHHINNDDILKLAGIDKRGNVSGCGMDMLFHCQYNLFCNLCPTLRYQDKMKQYRTL